VTLPVAILAGGLATRLGTITETIPKALLDVAGKPFVVQQLELLRAHGIRKVVLCIAHLGHMIQEVLGDGSRYGLELAYSADGDQLLGTGGALRRALPLLGERFFILYGDSYLTCDYADVERAFEASGKLGLMTVFRNDGRYDSSNVSYRDGRILRYDKTDKGPTMTHIDYGLGVLRAEALADYPPQRVAPGAAPPLPAKPAGFPPLDLATVYQDLLARDELAGYDVPERFYEIGSPAGLEETRALLSKEPS
jgi:NDP-sugar pyrophosphorylase family protein